MHMTPILAKDGMEGLALFKQYNPPIVITDIRMNGSHQIRATIGEAVFVSALVDYEDITGVVVNQADPAVF